MAFRNLETDWQIWIEVGARPIPRRLVITSKAVAGAPQYTMTIRDWRNEVSTDAFAFRPAAGAKKTTLADLKDIDELPAGTPTTGGKK